MSQTIAGPQVEPVTGASARPLCVDLDGTLVRSDTLIDSLLVLTRSHPSQLVHVPGKLLGGKAALKEWVTSIVSLDVPHLPYNRKLLAYLEQARGEGRVIYLATGADSKLAHSIADYLRIFDGVLASDGTTNLTAGNKLEGLRRHFGPGGFDYVGNARPDFPLLQQATEPMLANADLSLRTMLKAKGVKVARSFDDKPPVLRTLMKAIRLHQWAKNVLLFVPLLLAHALRGPTIFRAALAFLFFSLSASATYIINDLLDIDADRRHPRKRNRPFASGNLSAIAGLGIVALFLAIAIAGSFVLLPKLFIEWLLIYLVGTLSYSLLLKRIMLVDVILLSGLYTARILAGGAATNVVISPWLAAFSVFLFLSLAMVKRFAEMENLRTTGLTPRNGRGYLVQDIEQLRSFGTSSAYASVVVFALYISGRDVVGLYKHPQRMWLMTPLMILWLSRVWLLASRGELDEDPVVFAVTDRTSLLIGLAAAVVAVMAL